MDSFAGRFLGIKWRQRIPATSTSYWVVKNQMTIGMKQVGPMAGALVLLVLGLVEFQRKYKCELPTKNEIETVVPEVKEPTRAEIGKHELHMGW